MFKNRCSLVKMANWHSIVVITIFFVSVSFFIPDFSFGLINYNQELKEQAEVLRVVELVDNALLIIYLYNLPIDGEILDVHWLSISDKRIYKNKDGLYGATLKNMNDNKTLYILFTEDKKHFSANFSGEFNFEDGSIVMMPLNEE